MESGEIDPYPYAQTRDMESATMGVRFDQDVRDEAAHVFNDYLMFDVDPMITNTQTYHQTGAHIRQSPSKDDDLDQEAIEHLQKKFFFQLP